MFFVVNSSLFSFNYLLDELLVQLLIGLLGTNRVIYIYKTVSADPRI